MVDCIFCKIANGEIPTIALYEDDEIMAFRDIDPKAPVHFLIIPKAHIESAAALTVGEGSLLGRMFALAAKLAAEAGLAQGYRVVTNIGKDGGQSVPHLHFHVLGGRQMGWPPG